jgi:ribosome-associated translation inhibitor RaiA
LKIPLQITSRDFTPSEALNQAIAEEVEKLELFCDFITRCHVIVEQPHKHHHKGKHFVVHIDLTVPGQELFIGRDRDDASYEDAHNAVSEAFRAARRQLQDYVAKKRGDVKSHSRPHA